MDLRKESRKIDLKNNLIYFKTIDFKRPALAYLMILLYILIEV